MNKEPYGPKNQVVEQGENLDTRDAKDLFKNALQESLTITSLGAAGIAFIYACGYLINSTFTTSFGLPPQDFFKAEYLEAGIFFLFISIGLIGMPIFTVYLLFFCPSSHIDCNKESNQGNSKSKEREGDRAGEGDQGNTNLLPEFTDTIIQKLCSFLGRFALTSSRDKPDSIRREVPWRAIFYRLFYVLLIAIFYYIFIFCTLYVFNIPKIRNGTPCGDEVSSSVLAMILFFTAALHVLMFMVRRLNSKCESQFNDQGIRAILTVFIAISTAIAMFMLIRYFRETSPFFANISASFWLAFFKYLLSLALLGTVIACIIPYVHKLSIPKTKVLVTAITSFFIITLLIFSLLYYSSSIYPNIPQNRGGKYPLTQAIFTTTRTQQSFITMSPTQLLRTTEPCFIACKNADAFFVTDTHPPFQDWPTSKIEVRVIKMNEIVKMDILPNEYLYKKSRDQVHKCGFWEYVREWFCGKEN